MTRSSVIPPARERFDPQGQAGRRRRWGSSSGGRLHSESDRVRPFTMPCDVYTDMVHRLCEMWQQSDCNSQNPTRANPTGCLSDLYHDGGRSAASALLSLASV